VKELFARDKRKTRSGFL